MKKVSKVLSALLPSSFVLALSLGALPLFASNGAGEDTAIYSNEPTVTSFDQPDVRNYAGDEDEDEDVTVEVDKVVLHYYNESGGIPNRAFYLWVTGVDGMEFNTKFGETYNPGGIMTVDSEYMMTITIDFSTELFAEFAHRSGIYFIIKYALINESNLNWGGQSDDMFIRYADYPQAVNDQKVCELWTMPAAGGGIAILDSYNKTQVHGVALAKFKDWRTIHCTLTKDTRTVNWKLYAYDQTYYKIKPKHRPENQKWYLVKEGTGTGDFDIKFKYEAHINVVYSLESHDPSTDSDPDMAALSKVVTVGIDNLYDSTKFHTYYENANLNKQLGMTYTPEATTFRVWSPIAANIKVLIYDKDTTSEYCGSDDPDTKKAYDKYDGYQMQYTSGGIWELTIQGLPEGKYYNYQVDNSLGTNVVMDPYATSAGANGLRGLVYDKNGSKVTPDGWSELPLKWDGQTDKGLDITTPQQLSIYEVHIQDFTGDASWGGPENERGTYKGFFRSGTKIQGYTTGYDHLNELGVNAVQIMPTFDHDNNEVTLNGQEPKYNWGYNPLNYNVPEGAYSSNPHDGYARVKEFRELVLGMSKTEAHTRTIMDVVYNHVSSATGSNFHKLMPRYYFRYAMKDYTYYWEEWDSEQGKMVTKSSTVKTGELWDGSGCHNEVASERPMMRKFIIDSLCMWATDYKIKGFRFDLMGLIDFRTLLEAKKALYKIDPDIYMYGEGWTSGGYHGEGSSEWNEYYGAPDVSNYGAFTWQVYNECNNFRDGTIHNDEIFLGGFNDHYRNALRGGNDLGGGNKYPGSGWIQNGTRRQDEHGNWYTDFGALDSIGYGLWGLNYDIRGNGQPKNDDHTGRFPEQSVSYASCHDNWTLRDQLFQTMDQTAETIMVASMETHAFIFASNSPAFILGGEEIFRTKTIPDSLIDKITDKSSYLPMYGNWVSHNSYNSPLEVNTFKWGNKVEFTVSGERDGTPFSSTVSNATAQYTDHFAGMIKAHANLKFKRGANISRCEEFVTRTSEDIACDGIYWKLDADWSNCIGFQGNETFVYAHSGGYTPGEKLNGIPAGFTRIDNYGHDTGHKNMYYSCRRA